MEARVAEYQLKKIEDYLPHSHVKDDLPYVLSLSIRVNNDVDAATLKSEIDGVLSKYNLLRR